MTNPTSGNWVLVASWAMFTFAAFRVIQMHHQFLLGRILWTGFISFGIGLAIYYSLWTKQQPKTVAGGIAVPSVVPVVKIMPFDPPYPMGTVIAGIRFEPGTFDVRFFLPVKGASVKNVDLTIRLVNTSGQILAIQALATTFPGITIIPIVGPPGGGSLDSAQIRDESGKVSTVPVGSASSLGTFVKLTDTWHIHCAELFINTMPEFVLMVSRPDSAKMIEGFFMDLSYEYDIAGETRKANLGGFMKFDELGGERRFAPEGQFALLRDKSCHP